MVFFPKLSENNKVSKQKKRVQVQSRGVKRERNLSGKVTFKPSKQFLVISGK
jgi:hypothetical protein